MRWLPLSFLTPVGVGWGLMILSTMVNILVQMLTPDGLRGRVMSIYTVSFLGMMPVGALLAGAVAQATGEPLTVTLGAVSLAYLRAHQLRALE